jgi:uncharacterized membrane protein
MERAIPHPSCALPLPTSSQEMAMRRIAAAAATCALLATACAETRTPVAPEDALEARGASALRFTSIEVPGATATWAYSINQSGQIVGQYLGSSGVRGFLLTRGTFTTLHFPGSSFTSAWGINSRGHIVGRYNLPGDPRIYGFLLKDGVYTDISNPDHLHIMPTGISDSGEIVGCVHGTDWLNDMRGYVQRGDEVTLFEALPSTMHNGVTAGGQVIVGFSHDAEDIINGYVIDRGVYSQFSVHGSPRTQAWDVNQSGDVVGSYLEEGRWRAFLRTRRELAIIDFPGSESSAAYGINAAGDIVGVYGSDGVRRAFIASRTGRAH